jgi:UDP-glucuronate 4-epimerase
MGDPHVKKVLVTGGAGFIGSNLADALLRRGDTVVALDNFDPFYSARIKRANLAWAHKQSRYTFYQLDIRHEDPVRAVFDKERPDVVVHLAAKAGVRPSLRDPKLYQEVNVIGAQHILDACRDFPPSHLVFASSSSVYGGCTETPFCEDNPVAKPISPYAATKRMNELMGHVYSHIYGLKITMLRFFTVYGPRGRPDMAISKFTRLIGQGKPVPMYGDGTTRRDYTYIDDILDGVLKAVDRPFDFEIINLGESRTTALSELIDLIARQVGRAAEIEHLPLQPGDVLITCASVDKAKKLLGYDPQFSLEQGIAEFVAWHREHAAAL